MKLKNIINEQSFKTLVNFPFKKEKSYKAKFKIKSKKEKK